MGDDEKKKPSSISFVPSKQMRGYLLDVVKAGGYGNNPTSVVQQMAWECIRKLVNEGWIERKEDDEAG
jgi:hypothetical protein